MTTSPDSPALEETVAALKTSVVRLRGIVESLTSEQLRTPAYPSEWTVAQVLSHIGSAAVIQRLRLDASVAGTDLADDFAQAVWTEWDAKSPEAQRADALAADQAMIDHVDALSIDERNRFRSVMGPLELDLAQFVGLRLNEHALHTWDIEVTFDPRATVAREATNLVVDNLTLIARFSARPSGIDRTVRIQTRGPTRAFTLEERADTMTLTPELDPTGPADLELPAEAFIRLVYGRLDPDHTPPVAGTADLGDLRRTFPGV